MHDLLIAGATLVDGTGAAAATADVAVKDGRIVEVGRITDAARERIDAAGAWLTPGFVDIHTHYDGQASWDETFSPSIHHGVTTLLMGNCGVGFAPLRKGPKAKAVADLIDLMEGVEDIPGVALAEGVRFDWESFPQYMDALARLPHSLDYLVQVPHDPVRMAVMGERVHVLRKALPVETHAFGQRHAGDVFHAFHQVDQVGLPAFAQRREADAAVAHHQRRHAVVDAGREGFIPAGLAVVVGVDVDETGHQPGAIGGDALARRTADAAQLDDAAALYADVGRGRCGAAAVDDGGALDQQVEHIVPPVTDAQRSVAGAS
jgi:hypothetical protein